MFWLLLAAGGCITRWVPSDRTGRPGSLTTQARKHELGCSPEVASRSSAGGRTVARPAPARSQHHKENDEPNNCTQAFGDIDGDAHTHVSLHLDCSGENPWPRVKNPLTTYYAPLLARPAAYLGWAASVRLRGPLGQVGPGVSTPYGRPRLLGRRHLKRFGVTQWAFPVPKASISGRTPHLMFFCLQPLPMLLPRPRWGFVRLNSTLGHGRGNARHPCRSQSAKARYTGKRVRRRRPRARTVMQVGILANALPERSIRGKPKAHSSECASVFQGDFEMQD